MSSLISSGQRIKRECQFVEALIGSIRPVVCLLDMSFFFFFAWSGQYLMIQDRNFNLYFMYKPYTKLCSCMITIQNRTIVESMGVLC